MKASAGNRMERLGARQRSYALLNYTLQFLLHQFLSTWGLFVAVPLLLMFVCEVSVRVRLTIYVHQMQSFMYGTPFFPAHVVLAVFVGWVLGGTLQEDSMLWVWVLPLVSLFASHWGVPLIATGPSENYRLLALSSKLVYSWGRLGVHSLQQIVRIALLYLSLAYSFGALLAFRILRTPTFFDNMRSLRKMRLILVVGVPWFCFKFLLSWQSVKAQFPAAQTSAGLHLYLKSLAIISAFLTFFLAVAVGAAGRRYFLARLFLRPPTGAERSSAF